MKRQVWGDGSWQVGVEQIVFEGVTGFLRTDTIIDTSSDEEWRQYGWEGGAEAADIINVGLEQQCDIQVDTQTHLIVNDASVVNTKKWLFCTDPVEIF